MTDCAPKTFSHNYTFINCQPQDGCTNIDRGWQRAYQAIYSVMNEQCLVIAGFLTETKSLKEVESGLTQLADRLVCRRHLIPQFKLATLTCNGSAG